ncbi:MAG: hypothetical protein WB511_03455 [Nitrososphaeraceae archaeon]
MSRAKINMPMSARSGIALLIIGAIVVGVGTYTSRGALSIYGLILVIGGFSLYIISSLYVKRNTRK